MRLLAWLALLLSSIFVSSSARGEPRPPSGADVLEDALAEGDLDEDDVPSLPSDSRPGGEAAGPGWVSLVGFWRQLVAGQEDVGAMVVVGVPFDRVARGPTGGLADPRSPVPAASAPTSEPSSAPPPVHTGPALTASLARRCVAASLRTAGLEIDDSRLDDLLARSRQSAWLPEARTRIMRLLTDAAHSTTLATNDGTTYYSAIGAHLVLELRLTWRFDRLIYAGDEPALERMRLERQEARSRLAAKTLEVLFSWQRAVVDQRESLAGSREELEAKLRASEAQVTLDVLTGGWFSRRGTDEGD
jgi:hypothetical protein